MLRLRCHVTEPLESHAERLLVQEGERVAVARGQHDSIHRRAWMAEGREIGMLGGASELLPGPTAELMRPKLCSGAGRAPQAVGDPPCRRQHGNSHPAGGPATASPPSSTRSSPSAQRRVPRGTCVTASPSWVMGASHFFSST